MATTDATPLCNNSEATDSDASSACAVWQASRKHQRNTVIARSIGPSFVSEYRLVPPPVQLLLIPRVLETQPAQPHPPIIDAMPVEMHYVIGLAGSPRTK